MKKIYPKAMYDREFVRCFGESQFDTVIGGIDFSMFIMLNKELLYTMITRASKKFILCAQTKALQYAITKEQIIHRQTYLMDDLDELCNKKFDF